MAMRIFKKIEFEKELERAGLVKTDQATATSRLWRAQNGQHIFAPEHADEYPDSILEDVLRQVGLLYRKPKG
jgi:hypothetical protein